MTISVLTDLKAIKLIIIYLKSKEVVEQGYKFFFFRLWLIQELKKPYGLYVYEKYYKGTDANVYDDIFDFFVLSTIIRKSGQNSLEELCVTDNVKLEQNFNR